MRLSSRMSARFLGAALVLFLAAPAPCFADDLVVFAAASLKNALDDVNKAYQAQLGGTVKTSYAASGPLATQIAQGAPADLFISADLDWMDNLQGKKQVREGTRSNLLGNALVLIAPADSKAAVDIAPNFPLAALLGEGHLAMGEPRSVPAGAYGKEALTHFGIWDAVAPKVTNADSVRAALALVSRGEAPFGIVYRTDAIADKGVTIVGTFPENSHKPIIYPVAITAESHHADADKYLAFLRSPQATQAFEQQGFAVLR